MTYTPPFAPEVPTTSLPRQRPCSLWERTKTDRTKPPVSSEAVTAPRHGDTEGGVGWVLRLCGLLLFTWQLSATCANASDNVITLNKALLRLLPHFTFSTPAFYLLKYPLKCAPAGTAGAHFSGYSLFQQPMMKEPPFNFYDTLIN